MNVHDRIRPGLQRLATRRAVIPTVLVALLCVAGFQWRDARLGGVELLDTRQWYTPEQAADLFGALDRLAGCGRGDDVHSSRLEPENGDAAGATGG